MSHPSRSLCEGWKNRPQEFPRAAVVNKPFCDGTTAFQITHLQNYPLTQFLSGLFRTLKRFKKEAFGVGTKWPQVVTPGPEVGTPGGQVVTFTKFHKGNSNVFNVCADRTPKKSDIFSWVLKM